LNIGFWIDKDYPENEFPAFRFEFDKNQYYQELSDFVDKILDHANCDVKERLIPYLSTIEAKKINNKRLNELHNDFIITEKQILYYEQYLLLEDFLQPKRKNDRKHLKNLVT